MNTLAECLIEEERTSVVIRSPFNQLIRYIGRIRGYTPVIVCLVSVLIDSSSGSILSSSVHIFCIKAPGTSLKGLDMVFSWLIYACSEIHLSTYVCVPGFSLAYDDTSDILNV